MTDSFVAIDFETANRFSNSACAIGMVRVESGAIAATYCELIRPPYNFFEYTDVHGLTWDDVSSAKNFAELWPDICGFIAGAGNLVAHNAPFDRRVLNACLSHANIEIDLPDFICTVQVARQAWGIRPTTLDNVCRTLGIPLNHHEALSDATASAMILQRSRLLKKAEGSTGINPTHIHAECSDY
jgi:DNA polymerase III subunit epsilon